MTPSDRRALIYLLERLCQHEECIIESCELADGSLPRNDALGARAAMQSNRVWDRAQSLILQLQIEQQRIQEDFNPIEIEMLRQISTRKASA